MHRADLPPEHAAPLRRILDRGEGFGHRQHLELAYVYVRTLGPAAAEQAMIAAIRHVANEAGTPEKFHHTLTVAWVRAVAAHPAPAGERSFDDFLAAYPQLLDRGLLEHHYTRERLFGTGARAAWVIPDRQPFPPPVGAGLRER